MAGAGRRAAGIAAPSRRAGHRTIAPGRATHQAPGGSPAPSTADCCPTCKCPQVRATTLRGPRSGAPAPRARRRRTCRLRGVRADGAEQAVALVARPCREIEDVGRARDGAVAEADTPQAVDPDRLLRGGQQSPGPLPATLRVLAEGGDVAVAEVADEQRSGGLAEAGRGRPGEAPGGVELAARCDAPASGRRSSSTRRRCPRPLPGGLVVAALRSAFAYVTKMYPPRFWIPNGA